MRKITSILSRIFFAFLFFQTIFGNMAFAATVGEKCGFTATCDKGMVCIGATDALDNGECRLMPIVVSLCTVFNWIQEYSTYFMIFAVVALGFAFFLGKISWGMIISVVLGVAVIKGAILITQKITGVSKNLCSAKYMQKSSTTSCSNAKWVLDVSRSIMGTKNLYNVVELIDFCPSAMQCTKKLCIPYDRWGQKSNGSDSNEPTLDDINNERRKNGLEPVTSLLRKYSLRHGSNKINEQQIVNYEGYVQDVDVYYVHDELKNISPDGLQSKFKRYMECSQVQNNITQNFLVCTNSCTGNTQTVQSTSATTCAAAGLV